MAVTKPPSRHHHTPAYSVHERASRKEVAVNATKPGRSDQKEKSAAKDAAYPTFGASAPSATQRPDKFTAPPKNAGLQTPPTHEPIGRSAQQGDNSSVNNPGRGQPLRHKPNRAGSHSARGHASGASAVADLSKVTGVLPGASAVSKPSAGPAPRHSKVPDHGSVSGKISHRFLKMGAASPVQRLNQASSPLGDLSKVRLHSQGSQLVSSGPKAYSYAPSVMRDRHGTYKMWFGGLAPSGSGDAIYYSRSKSPSSGWSKPKPVFTAAPGHFDGLDVCDPSVVRDAKGTFYMYYGAAKADNVGMSAGGKAWTSIGLATSPDGVNWNRVKSASGGDLMVVPPAHPEMGTYGAGQPSVVYKDGYFQMLYTDTSVTGSDNVYRIRSPSPSFDTQVESFDASNGLWNANVPATSRKPLVPGGADTEWAMVGDKFVTTGGSGGALTLSTFNSSGPPQLQSANVPGVKTSGNVAFIRTESGDLALRAGNKWDVMATVSDPAKVNNGPVDSPYTWSLRHLGFGRGA
jgi:hypothetical protein